MAHRIGAWVCLTASLLLAPPASARTAGAGSAPTVRISNVNIDRAKWTVDVHVRLCESLGLRSIILVTERRSLDGVVKATARWTDPTGVDLTSVYPYACVAGYEIAWAPKPHLAGRGTYVATVRVRDGYGKWSTPASFSRSFS
jgi:hypothetical protein